MYASNNYTGVYGRRLIPWPAIPFDCTMRHLKAYLSSCGLEINLSLSYNAVVVQRGRRKDDWQIYLAQKEPKPERP